MKESEFTEVIAGTKQFVLAAIWRYLPERYVGQLDDIAQETYLRVFRALEKGSFRDEAALSTWIYRIAANETKRMVKKLMREERQAADISDHFLDSIADNRSGFPDYSVDNEDAQKKFLEISDAIESLPSPFRPLFQLFLGGKNDKEAAKILHISPGTVKSRKSRGISKLAAYFAGGKREETI